MYYATAKEMERLDKLAVENGQVFVADIGIPGFLYDKIAPGSRPAFGSLTSGETHFLFGRLLVE